MTIDVLPCRPDEWLVRLAEGWRFGLPDDALTVADFTEWNNGWPVVLLSRPAPAEGAE